MPLNRKTRLWVLWFRARCFLRELWILWPTNPRLASWRANRIFWMEINEDALMQVGGRRKIIKALVEREAELRPHRVRLRKVS